MNETAIKSRFVKFSKKYIKGVNTSKNILNIRELLIGLFDDADRTKSTGSKKYYLRKIDIILRTILNKKGLTYECSKELDLEDFELVRKFINHTNRKSKRKSKLK